MTERPHDSGELRLLVEDFWSSRPVTPPGRSPVIPIEGPPVRLLLEEYELKLNEGATAAAGRDLPPDPSGVTRQLLLAEFDPSTRYPPMPGPSPVVPVDEAPGFHVAWGDPDLSPNPAKTRGVAFAAHLAAIVFLLAQPYAGRPPEPTDPESESDYTQVTLLAPSQEVMEQLTRGREAEERIFRGDDEAAQSSVTRLTQPVPATPAPEVDRPAPPQPIEVEEPPEEPETPKPTAIEPEPTPEPEPQPVTPAATAPRPDDFQRGRQIARVDRPRELPAPRAPKKAPERPKLVLEDPKATMPGRADERITLGSLGVQTQPSQVIESAIEQMKQQGGGRQAVGDGVGASPNAGYLPPSPGNIGSGVELLTDPKGVDFRPYLSQILNTIRRNWYAVLPESARLGIERGRVAIQFSVERTGDIPKLVIATPSGSQPLDRAAVAGISASQPLPPLPAEFTGDQIKLQFVFLYNMR